MPLSRYRIPLRWFAFWLGVGWFLIALVVFLSLAPSLPDLGPEGSDKLGHGLAYALLMFWFAQLYRRGVWWLLAAGFVLLGLVLEWLQGLTGYRTLDYRDLGADAIGVALGALLATTPLSGSLRMLESVFESFGNDRR